MDPLLAGACLAGLVIASLQVYQIYVAKHPATNPDGTPAAGPKLSDVGTMLKDKVNEVVADVEGVKDDVDATALDLGTRALLRRYLEHLPSERAAEVTATFQTLLTINATLPVPKAT